jgi:CTP:molybdopterin cytidylyltransferase MocA
VRLEYTLVIPVAGYSRRFRSSGILAPKWSLPVFGRSIIDWILSSLPEPHCLVFICRPGDEYSKTVLSKKYPTAVIAIATDFNNGPSASILSALRGVRLCGPTLVHYCDFFVCCDKSELTRAISSRRNLTFVYSGFHPHLFDGSTKYGHVTASGKVVTAIREKEGFLKSAYDELTSAGGYLFESADVMFECLESQISSGERVNGEFYVSLAQLPLLGKLEIFEVRRFFQLGTPEDYELYRRFGQHYRALSGDNARDISSSKLIPTMVMTMMGRGERFRVAGHELWKPLIKVTGTPMFATSRNLIRASSQVFLVAPCDRRSEIEKAVRELPSNNIQKKFNVIALDSPTDGQADTVYRFVERFHDVIGPNDLGILVLPVDLVIGDEPAVISSRDLGDAVIYCVRPTPPMILAWQSYSWIRGCNGKIENFYFKGRGLSIDEIESHRRDFYIVTGAFLFRSRPVFSSCYERARAAGVFGEEQYIDNLFQDAEVRSFARYVVLSKSWIVGTPEELRTYDYMYDQCSVLEQSLVKEEKS